METKKQKLPYWKRPDRWLAFFLSILGICSFLAIVPMDATQELNEAEPMISPSDSWIDNLREGTRELAVPGHWTSLAPPLLAVMVAAYFRSLVFALLSAFCAGAFLSFGMNPITTAVLALHDFLYLRLKDSFSLFTFAFLFTLVGLAHVIGKNGGLSGLVEKIAVVAKGPKRARLTVALSGLVVFFDDYANTVIVGSTMQKLSDKWRISREKLAYLVDSTTAPVASLAILSTWIAFEAQLLGDEAEKLGIEMSGYSIFIEMWPMRFYCIGTLIFLLLSSMMGRDFGAMYRAEKRAAETGKLTADEHQKLGIQSTITMEPKEGTPFRWYNAMVPILTVILGTVVGILWVGDFRLKAAGELSSFTTMEGLRKVFEAAVNDPAGVMPILFFAAVLGCVVAFAMTVLQGLMSFGDTVRSFFKGMPTMWMAIFILLMTWSMRAICSKLGTTEYLIALMGDNMPLWLLPLMTFVVASLISFAIGTSWGTMGILIPIALQTAYDMGGYSPGYEIIFFLTAAAVLDGAIFGDHCSPISDTTVLSSICTGCDHIAHVNTQFTYALTTMILCSAFGYLAVAGDMPLWLFYILFPLGSVGVLALFGRRTPIFQALGKGKADKQVPGFPSDVASKS